ncbi:hypothetical protein C1H21_04705 [Xanthomonas arboricola pv. juglandis]|nr:hypothetical protein C1H21_04705 [Xanthomonas arboricola pv. juglandis]
MRQPTACRIQPVSVLTASPAALQSSNSLIALECIGRRRGALIARGLCRKPVRGDRVATSMPPHGPASGEDTAPESGSVAL